jgi:hypothetical protein
VLWINDNYSFKTTPVPNSYVYKSDLIIRDLNIYDVSPSGFSATFRTEKNQAVCVEWTVYPSDWYTVSYCGDGRWHRFCIETYPEGGTVVYRITDGIDWMSEHGTVWLYQDLPRPANKTVLPPPYYKGN